MLNRFFKLIGFRAADHREGHKGLIHGMSKNSYTFVVDILGYREDGEWVALALDMDLRGYGKTIEEAHKDLMDHIRMQISFAIQKQDINLVNHPADQKYYELFAEAKREALRSFLNDNKEEPKYLATGKQVSKSDFITGGDCYAPA